jgi:molybdopterin synthase sulfur carrier subunit
MAIAVRIPAVLRSHVGGSSSVQASAGLLRDVVSELAGKYPALGEQLLDEDGELHRFVNIYLNDEDVRYLDGLDTKLADGDVLSILPAVAGGSG